jgi:hypothetical protein
MCLVLPAAERRGNKALTAQRRIPPGAKRRGERGPQRLPEAGGCRQSACRALLAIISSRISWLSRSNRSASVRSQRYLGTFGKAINPGRGFRCGPITNPAGTFSVPQPERKAALLVIRMFEGRTSTSTPFRKNRPRSTMILFGGQNLISIRIFRCASLTMSFVPAKWISHGSVLYHSWLFLICNTG